MKMGRMWNNHGTKIMGWFVAILGAMTAFADDITALWWDDRGDLKYQLCVKVANYLLVGAGAIIIRRGYSNTRRAGEKPVTPGE